MSHIDSGRTVMAVLENTIVQMIRDSGAKWHMVGRYPKPNIGWVILGVQSIEKTEEFAITDATNITNFHDRWLPQGMPKQRIGSPKLLTISITVDHWALGGGGLEENGSG